MCQRIIIHKAHAVVTEPRRGIGHPLKYLAQVYPGLSELRGVWGDGD